MWFIACYKLYLKKLFLEDKAQIVILKSRNLLVIKLISVIYINFYWVPHEEIIKIDHSLNNLLFLSGITIH